MLLSPNPEDTNQLSLSAPGIRFSLTQGGATSWPLVEVQNLDEPNISSPPLKFWVVTYMTITKTLCTCLNMNAYHKIFSIFSVTCFTLCKTQGITCKNLEQLSP